MEPNRQNRKKSGHVPTDYLINWVGGKRLMRKYIEPLVPRNIKSYCEAFGGGAHMLFYKNRWADLEIYNDLDGRLVNLFRIVKYHPQELEREISLLLGSREMFEQFMEQDGYT
ncbi:MAG: DNA adenine methylase, partial [Candidatus Gastranaerophilales bacterium]|nr:DNA adenine methylase [Candidatus Gastranaerophilales bacterium]